MADKTGGCMCGAVRFTLAEAPDRFGACHCEMCRRWAGSALLSVHVPASGITFTNEAQIRTLQSSEWAERAWCGRCGSGLYYRVTMDGAPAEYSLPIGLLDDASGMEFDREVYIDHKPSAFAFEGDRTRLTRSETLAHYGIEETEV